MYGKSTRPFWAALQKKLLIRQWLQGQGVTAAPPVLLVSCPWLWSMLPTYQLVCKFFSYLSHPSVLTSVAACHLPLFDEYRIYSFCSPGPYSSTGACYFKVKLCTKIIFEDKYFTTLILFPCQFIHIKRKLFIFIYSRLKSNYSASCSLHQSHHPHQHQARFLL